MVLVELDDVSVDRMPHEQARAVWCSITAQCKR